MAKFGIGRWLDRLQRKADPEKEVELGRHRLRGRDKARAIADAKRLLLERRANRRDS